MLAAFREAETAFLDCTRYCFSQVVAIPVFFIVFAENYVNVGYNAAAFGRVCRAIGKTDGTVLTSLRIGSRELGWVRARSSVLARA